MATLPERFLRTTRELRQIQVGETVYVSPGAMRVNTDSSCFLSPSANVHREKSVAQTLRVFRDADGYHVTILAPWTWEREAWMLAIRGYFPVASIATDLDPELDIDAKLNRLLGSLKHK